MTDSRRDFLKQLAASGIVLQSQVTDSVAVETPRETICRVNILTNQLGYLTQGSKMFVVESNIDSLKPTFFIRDTEYFGEDHRVFHGQMQEVDGDFGKYFMGDFSGFHQPGKYVIDIYTDTAKDWYSSQVFAVDDDPYRAVLDKGIECFATQRCGPSTTGYHAPCHLDDGVRADNGKFLDVVGGWHDASDLLKWSNATLTGMMGLLQIAENSHPRMSRILEEVKWGNLYFLKLQDTQGYYYDYGIGGDPVWEGNHFTDNIRGTADDRKVVTGIGAPYLQHMFISAQAHLAAMYRNWDSPYTRACLEAGVKCFQWVRKQPSHTYLDFGTGTAAGLKLYQATGERSFLEYAVTMADRFAGLQETTGERANALRGYFYEDETRSNGASHISSETFAMIGFAEFIETAKKVLDVSKWQEALDLYCNDYLMTMASLNAFGIVPYQVKLKGDFTPGSRSYAGTTYRYFMRPISRKWWVGNNANLAGTGIVLCYAARILGSEKYRGLAQRMLDWILGLNPFDVSLVNGIGYKNPPEYVYTGFKPRTPRIQGSVMCGIAGDEHDRPDLQSGSYHSAEIWTPMTIQTMWLASELWYSNSLGGYGDKKSMDPPYLPA